jgi:hypothetical protein
MAVTDTLLTARSMTFFFSHIAIFLVALLAVGVAAAFGN